MASLDLVALFPDRHADRSAQHLHPRRHAARDLDLRAARGHTGTRDHIDLPSVVFELVAAPAEHADRVGHSAGHAHALVLVPRWVGDDAPNGHGRAPGKYDG